MGFHEVTRLNYNNLNSTEKEMLSYLSDHLEELADLSINDMAAMLKSSRSSVLRMAQKLGYRGYSQMKYEMKQAVETKEVIPANLEEQFRKDVARTFDLADQFNFMPLVQAMDQAGQLIVYATGFVQNNYAKQFCSELFMSGKPNYLVSGESNFSIIARTLTEKDLVIIVSFSGNTPGIQDTVNLLNVKKVPICSVTRLSRNFLTEAARYSLFYETSDLPLPAQQGASMNTLGILLSVLSRKYLEYVLYDEI